MGTEAPDIWGAGYPKPQAGGLPVDPAVRGSGDPRLLHLSAPSPWVWWPTQHKGLRPVSGYLRGSYPLPAESLGGFLVFSATPPPFWSPLTPLSVSPTRQACWSRS